jgi:hypothetical protein
MAAAISGAVFMSFEDKQDTSGVHVTFVEDDYSGPMLGSLKLWRELKNSTRSFEAIAAYSQQAVVVSFQGKSIPVRATLVTSNFFEAAGCARTSVTTVSPGLREAYLTRGFWREVFGEAEEVVGNSIRNLTDEYFIRGIVEDEEVMPAGTELYLVLDEQTEAGGSHYHFLGKLAAGTSIHAGQTEVAQFLRDHGRQLQSEMLLPKFRIAPLEIMPEFRGGRGARLVLLAGKTE